VTNIWPSDGAAGAARPKQKRGSSETPPAGLTGQPGALSSSRMRYLVGVLAILVSGAVAAPLPTAAPGDLDNMQPIQGPAKGSKAGALDRLFESLREAQSPEIAWGIEQVIWSIWLRAGSDEADQLIALSIEAMNARDNALARSHLDKVVALEPAYAEGWNKRATVYYIEGDYGRSLADIRRVLELEPRHFGALSGLGLILEKSGSKEKALEAFRRALAVHPQMPAIRQRVEALSLEVEGVDL